jgi:hypothetical protein
MRKVAVESSTQILPVVGDGVGARVGGRVGARVGARVLTLKVLGASVGARLVGAAVEVPVQYAGFGLVFVSLHTSDWIQLIWPLVRE